MLSRDQIDRLIPHRDPFSWIDEVVEISETTVVARKFLDPGLPVFAGHFPGSPVFPGVLLCEAAFQAGAVLLASLGGIAEGYLPVVTRQNETRFRRIVRPGETLEIEVTLRETLGGAWFLNGKVSVDGQVAVRLEFACTTAKGD